MELLSNRNYCIAEIARVFDASGNAVFGLCLRRFLAQAHVKVDAAAPKPRILHMGPFVRRRYLSHCPTYHLGLFPYLSAFSQMAVAGLYSTTLYSILRQVLQVMACR